VLAVLLTLVGAGCLTVIGSSDARFSGNSSNGGDNLAAGTVTLADDGSGSAMFTTGAPGTDQVSGSALKPGQTIVNCIKVSLTGTLPSTVVLYAPSTTDTNGTYGTGLRGYLHVKIEEGAAGSFGCSGFTTGTTIWDTSTHPGATSDLLSDFPSSYATGVSSALSPWPGLTSCTYRFSITVDPSIPDTSVAATSSATFTWEAHNV
jgi:hypothetical protein